MNEKNNYVIDASSLIELNKHNPIDVYPSVWNSLSNLINNGSLVSHREVLKEIERKDDKLLEWAKNQNGFFREVTGKQLQIVKEILSKYPSIVKVDRLNSADPFVIALAVEMTNQSQKTLFPIKRIVVTEERLRGNKIRIPLICEDYSIESMDVIEMFRVENIRF